MPPRSARKKPAGGSVMTPTKKGESKADRAREVWRGVADCGRPEFDLLAVCEGGEVLSCHWAL